MPVVVAPLQMDVEGMVLRALAHRQPGAPGGGIGGGAAGARDGDPGASGSLGSTLRSQGGGLALMRMTSTTPSKM